MAVQHLIFTLIVTKKAQLSFFLNFRMGIELGDTLVNSGITLKPQNFIMILHLYYSIYRDVEIFHQKG